MISGGSGGEMRLGGGACGVNILRNPLEGSVGAIITDSMIDASSHLRLRRTRAGLSQRELARRAGTSSATMSRYESGALVPNLATLNRLTAACLPNHRRWPSLTALAPALARTRAAQGSTAAWRLVGEVLDDEARGTTADTKLVIADPPGYTGDSAADALVAGLAEYLSLRRGIPAPGWTKDPDRVSRPWWFVADAPAWIPTSLRESPRSFATRGVFVTAAGLERR